MTTGKRLFTIVVPVFQNRDNLESTVPKLLGLAEKLPGYRLELVLVDDGSTDGSCELLGELANRHPDRVRVVLLTRNFGQNPAIQAGLRHATGDCVGIISCDLQEPCEKFVEMVKAWEQGHKFVLGERIHRQEGAWHRATSSVYWQLVRWFALPSFPAMGYDFCVMDRQVVDDINRINEKNSSIFVLIYWLGYTPARIPIARKLRQVGRSQWGLRKKIAFTIDTLIGFTYLPARIITAMGMATALLAVVYLMWVLYRWATLHAAPPGWVTVVGLVTLLGSMNLFALGILSEYLLRILDESRKRPPYVVDRVINPPSSQENG
jgi:dolichol-phosphate mannosyltransferase